MKAKPVRHVPIELRVLALTVDSGHAYRRPEPHQPLLPCGKRPHRPAARQSAVSHRSGDWHY